MPVARLLAFAAPYARSILLMSAVSLLAAVLMLALPWLAGKLFSGVLGYSPQDLSTVVALLATALIAIAGLQICSALLSAHTSGRILADLRHAVHGHVLRLPLSYHDQARQGDLLAMMTYEVASLARFLAGSLADLPGMVLTALGSLVLLFMIDPRSALLVPLLVPAAVVLLRLAGRHQRQLAAAAREADADLFALAETDLAMATEVKAFAVEERLTARYLAAAHRARRLAFRQARIGAVIGPALAAIAALAVIGLLVFAGAGADRANRDPGAMFSLLFYAALLARPVATLADAYGQLQWARGTLARLEGVMVLPVDAGYQPAAAIGRAMGAIRFEGLHFSYAAREPVLRGLDLAIRAGEVVALTGQNGVGKSTLINLLLRFYAPDSGRITLDGQDIAGLQVQQLRRQIGFVSQRASLFNGSVRDNLLFGQPDAPSQQLWRAMELAQAAQFVAALPFGLETQIGDDGVRLSGGQRQRLALARAFLADPPVLILDEATAMYDLAGEASFVDACKEGLRGRTVIIVTHRPASLALADRIIRLCNGQAIEVGGGTELTG